MAKEKKEVKDEPVVGGRRLVETGRVCLVNYGKYLGKLVVIINCIDGKRVLVDGHSENSGVLRQIMPLARLSITNIKVNINPGSRVKTLLKACSDAKVAEHWAASSWAKGIARKAAKASMGDFDRFKMMVARKTRARVVNKTLATMKKK